MNIYNTIRKYGAPLLMASALAVTGCNSYARVIEEKNSPKANGYDLELTLQGHNKILRIGKIDDAAKRRAYVYAVDADGKDGFEEVRFIGTSKESKLEELACVSRLNEIAKDLTDQQTFK